MHIPMAGRKRIIIEHVRPQVNGGQFPIKRVPGESVDVQAHIFSDGHDRVAAEILYREKGSKRWNSSHLRHTGNDEWGGRFVVEKMGGYEYTVRGWVDHFLTWQQDLKKKVAAGQDVAVDLQIGADLLSSSARRAKGHDADALKGYLSRLTAHAQTLEGQQAAVQVAMDPALTALVGRWPDSTLRVKYPQTFEVLVDRPEAVFGAWYEFFPRSCGPKGKHGTFKDCEKMLEEVAEMGFDVVYLPPIHPIGVTHRKGKNNATICTPGDPGSPWAIGGKEGGHTSIHPELGTPADFRRLIQKARQLGLEIAMDIAFQCSPDHPYVKEHPEWFRWRPDGTVQYAENPPKKYEDILPINFETPQWRPLWDELKNVVLHWVHEGVRIFRVDNPHTKPFNFWQWLIGQVRTDYPDVIFLAEAFTRPKVMKRLAKLGFDQSYTYFTWRNTKYEVQQYIKELTTTNMAEYFRPNFWPNTPDILPEFLQYGGRAAFIIRLVMAATLSSAYGIYGPAYELFVADAVEGKEEYKDSEKYEIRHWEPSQRGSLRPLIQRINTIRRQTPSLQRIRNIRFYETDNEMILCYGKMNEDKSDITVTVVSLDPNFRQSGFITLPLEEMEIDPHRPYLMHDLISSDKYIWQGERNYIELNPETMPAHILKVQKKMRRENDFDYFM